MTDAPNKKLLPPETDLIGLIPEPTEPDEELALALPEPIRRLSQPIRMGLDLIQLGIPATEAGKRVGIHPNSLYRAAHSELGKEYMALQYGELETWLKGTLFQAAVVIQRELMSPNENIRLRAAEALFKHLGGFLRGAAEDAGIQADATKLARAILAQFNINVNVNNGGAEPSPIIVNQGES